MAFMEDGREIWSTSKVPQTQYDEIKNTVFTSSSCKTLKSQLLDAANSSNGQLEFFEDKNSYKTVIENRWIPNSGTKATASNAIGEESKVILFEMGIRSPVIIDPWYRPRSADESSSDMSVSVEEYSRRQNDFFQRQRQYEFDKDCDEAAGVYVDRGPRPVMAPPSQTENIIFAKPPHRETEAHVIFYTDGSFDLIGAGKFLKQIEGSHVKRLFDRLNCELPHQSAIDMSILPSITKTIAKASLAHDNSKLGGTMQSPQATIA